MCLNVSEYVSVCMCVYLLVNMSVYAQGEIRALTSTPSPPPLSPHPLSLSLSLSAARAGLPTSAVGRLAGPRGGDYPADTAGYQRFVRLAC